MTKYREFGLITIAAVVIGFAAHPSYSQKQQKTDQSLAQERSPSIRSSPAYAEVLLRKTELAAEIESLLLEFTEEYPKVKASRFSLAQLQKQADVLLAIKPADAGKLTLALGKLMVRKTELETDLWALQENLADGHPDVKRAKRKVEIYEKAIREILG